MARKHESRNRRARSKPTWGMVCLEVDSENDLAPSVVGVWFHCKEAMVFDVAPPGPRTDAVSVEGFARARDIAGHDPGRILVPDEATGAAVRSVVPESIPIEIDADVTRVGAEAMLAFMFVGHYEVHALSRADHLDPALVGELDRAVREAVSSGAVGERVVELQLRAPDLPPTVLVMEGTQMVITDSVAEMDALLVDDASAPHGMLLFEPAPLSAEGGDGGDQRPYELFFVDDRGLPRQLDNDDVVRAIVAAHSVMHCPETPAMMPFSFEVDVGGETHGVLVTPPEEEEEDLSDLVLDPNGPTVQLRIALRDVDPPVWRRVSVPASITLPGLHVVIQTAMGWEDYHLHEFSFGQRLFQPDPEPDGFSPTPEDEANVRLDSLVERKGQRFVYAYDFGDDWYHDIEVESLGPSVGGQLVDCLDGARACPPEDSGGPWGYGDKLEIAARDDEDGEEIREWLGDHDPEAFDAAAVSSSLLRMFGQAPGADEPGRPVPDARR